MSIYQVRLEPSSLDLTIVIPVYNEEPNVESLATEIDSAMSQTPLSWECIWVDDRSTDDTFVKLVHLHNTHPRHEYVRIATHGGQSAALAAGFSASRGRYIATLDGDGQSDPADIPRLLAHLTANEFHVVNGRREHRLDNFVRRLSSRVANGFRNVITGEHVTDVGCSVRIFCREALDGIFFFKRMHRFLPTLMKMNGYDRIVEVPVRHRARQYGRTKYSISNRLWVGIADTLAIRWMKRRRAAPLIEASSIGPSLQPSANRRDLSSSFEPMG